MTREEAVEILMTAREMYPGKSVIRDAFTLALAALQPSNEPLTLEELREMEQSTPVWWDYIPCWVLVRRGSVLVFGSEPHKVENLFGYFYRRPPEGEEEP